MVSIAGEDRPAGGAGYFAGGLTASASAMRVAISLEEAQPVIVKALCWGSMMISVGEVTTGTCVVIIGKSVSALIGISNVETGALPSRRCSISFTIDWSSAAAGL